LKKFAADLGLNTDEFNNCLDTGKYATQVQKDTAFGQSLGISSTPAFAVDGQPLIGAQPFEVFKKLIDQGLSGN
jgi:protein-disulfide isomerase